MKIIMTFKIFSKIYREIRDLQISIGNIGNVPSKPGKDWRLRVGVHLTNVLKYY